VNELRAQRTAQRLKSEYLGNLKEAMSEAKSETAEKCKTETTTVNVLGIKQKGRPLLLGVDVDEVVQEYVRSLRMAGGIVNTLVAMAAQGIVAARDISKLVSHGDHIEITKIWARYLLKITRMGFVKRKCLTSDKIPLAEFERVKEIFSLLK